MKLAEIIEKSRKPVLDFREIEALSGIKAASLRVALSRLAKSGRVRRVERGKYTASSDPLAVSSYIVQPSYISTLAGLFVHKLTSQIPGKIDVFTSRRHRNVDFGNGKIEFFTVGGERMRGYGKVPYGKYQIFVGEAEKCIADMIYLGYPKYLAEEALGSGKIDSEKLLSYARGLGSAKYAEIEEMAG